MTVEADLDTYQGGNNDEGYAVYNIDTDISDIMMVNSTNSRLRDKWLWKPCL